MTTSERFREFLREFVKSPRSKQAITIPELIKLYNNKYLKNKIPLNSTAPYTAMNRKDGPKLKKQLKLVSGSTGVAPGVGVKIKKKSLGNALYERVYTDGSSKYYSIPVRDDKVYTQPLRNTLKEAKDDLAKFNKANPKKETVIDKQAKIVEERGGTLIDNPKLNQAIVDAKEEIKDYHKKIKVIHVPTFIDKHLGKNAQRREVDFFKSRLYLLPEDADRMTVLSTERSTERSTDR